MKPVIDANVVISALIANSKTRRLIVTLEPDLLTPAFVHDEVGNYEDLIVEKSGMDPDRVAQFIDLSFQYIEVVPASDFYPAIETTEAAIGDTDPDDVLYLARAIASDAAIWSGNSDRRFGSRRGCGSRIPRRHARVGRHDQTERILETRDTNQPRGATVERGSGRPGHAARSSTVGPEASRSN